MANPCRLSNKKAKILVILKVPTKCAGARRTPLAFLPLVKSPYQASRAN
jgi:hypothetical protein